MKVIFDTTVFGNGFHANSADVRLMKKFLETTSSELCVPSVVIEEAVNLVRKGIEEANQKLNTPQRLTGDSTTFAKFNVKKNLERYRSGLNALLKSLNARILPYPSVGHEELSNRAIAVTKPFSPGGRGYRDAVIWYAVLDLASKCKGQEVAFITANSDDFCKSKTELELHSDLVADLKGRGLDVKSFRLFDSLPSFIQKCAVKTLPVSSPPKEITPRSPDYQQLLIDGSSAIETMLVAFLPDFLRGLSRASLRVEDLDVLGTSAPAAITPLPIRMVDNERRLLEFSAKYTVAVRFLIQKPDLAIWSQRLSLHQREEWDESRFRIHATRAIRVLFRLIEKGENTESFDIVSITPAYYAEYTGFDPVAVKLHQSEIHAPDYTDWGTVTCDSCGETFGVGFHRLYPQPNEMEYVSKLDKILAADHKVGRAHQNLYELTS